MAISSDYDPGQYPNTPVAAHSLTKFFFESLAPRQSADRDSNSDRDVSSRPRQRQRRHHNDDRESAAAGWSSSNIEHYVNVFGFYIVSSIDEQKAP
jgi:hypothetical protein